MKTAIQTTAQHSTREKLIGRAQARERTRTCHEDVARLGHTAALPKELKEVPKLAVDVSTDRYGACDGLYVGFFHEQGADAIAEDLHVGFREVLAAHELLDPLVRVVACHASSVGIERKTEVREIKLETSDKIG